MGRRSKPPVSMGGVVLEEDLPLKYVHYPPQYGAFIAFSDTKKGSPKLCSCVLPAIDNLQYFWRNGLISENDLRRQIPYALQGADVFSRLTFGEKLCHRCNLKQPSVRYCHEMYGGRFMQYYGWYVNQNYFRFGVLQNGKCRPGVCPPEIQEKAQELAKALEHLRKTTALQDRWEVEKEVAKARRRLNNILEDITREEFGFRKIGERWVSETMLYNIVKQIYEGREVLRHYRPSWLHGLELDIYVPDLQIAFEYQGQQHFFPIEAWGGEDALRRLQARDERKRQICKQRGVTLITVDYFEPLTEEHIREKIRAQ